MDTIADALGYAGGFLIAAAVTFYAIAVAVRLVALFLSLPLGWFRLDNDDDRDE